MKNVNGVGDTFGSASAFSMHVKRFQTPGKQGDDGWKSVTYEGIPLEQFRREFNSGTGVAAKVNWPKKKRLFVIYSQISARTLYVMAWILDLLSM